MNSIDGILVIAKPGGMTSHDVVARIRRATGQRRIGHAGTLDPDATGVLVVLLGRATTAMRFMLGLPKAYRAEMVLGIVTDTHDASGRVIRVASDVKVSRALFQDVTRRFTGEILQVPPMVSAVHHEGRRLYELAREGIEVERAPRRVTVYEINVESWPDDPPTVGTRITVSVVCSSGTYIRQLAADIGEALGCGAHLGSLVRTRVGRFMLTDAHTLDEIEASARESRLRALVLPIAAGLSHLPAVAVSGEDARKVACGAQVELPAAEYERVSQQRREAGAVCWDDRSCAGIVRVHGASGELLGVARLEASGEQLTVRPIRVFVG
ncbi:MAG: tRNA pseudouridine(55) synthase TruB [Betaproteobacteria bacterium]